MSKEMQDLRIEAINNQYGFDTANDIVAVCESGKSNSPVVKFEKLHKFNDNFIAMKINNVIDSVFYKRGKVVAKDIHNNIYNDILEND